MPCDADVDPRSGRHLAVHRQAAVFEVPERLPVGPGRHEQRVGDEHARRPGMRAEDADGLARLHEQRFVVLERPQRRARWRRTRASCARRGPTRRTRRDRPAARRRPDRDCSSACAARLPAATPLQDSDVPRGARISASGGRHGQFDWMNTWKVRHCRQDDGHCQHERSIRLSITMFAAHASDPPHARLDARPMRSSARGARCRARADGRRRVVGTSARMTPMHRLQPRRRRAAARAGRCPGTPPATRWPGRSVASSMHARQALSAAHMLMLT